MLSFVNQSLGTSLRPPDSLFPWHIQSITKSHRYHNICSYCSVPQLCPTLQPHDCSMPGFHVLHHLLEPIESVMPSNHLILCHPLLLLSSIFPSIKVFSNELALQVRWPKYWSFSFSISPSNEYSGLISFRMDWFDLLAVQGTLKSLLQHQSSKACPTQILLSPSTRDHQGLDQPQLVEDNASFWVP